MMMSLRKSFSETSLPEPAPVVPVCHTLFIHLANSGSWETPCSMLKASYSVRPGDLRLVLGSPPSRCLTTSVVRLSALTLLTPATYCPSHFTLNLKFLYGSNRLWFTVNWAIFRLPTPAPGLPSAGCGARRTRPASAERSEEHTSELQSRGHLVCR